MFFAMRHRRERLVHAVQDYVHQMELKEDSEKTEAEKNLVHLLMDWLEAREEKSDKCSKLFDKMKPLFEEILGDNKSLIGVVNVPLINRIWSDRGMYQSLLSIDFYNCLFKI